MVAFWLSGKHYNARDERDGGATENVGYWIKTTSDPVFDPDEFSSTVSQIRKPNHIVLDPRRETLGVAVDGEVESSEHRMAWDLLREFYVNT